MGRARSLNATRPRIHASGTYVTAKNLGATFNHNFVIEQARGEFFKWVSDDDLYAPNLLQDCVDALGARPEVALAHAWTAYIDDQSMVTHRPEYPLDTDVADPVERFRSLLLHRRRR